MTTFVESYPDVSSATTALCVGAFRMSMGVTTINSPVTDLVTHLRKNSRREIQMSVRVGLE